MMGGPLPNRERVRRGAPVYPITRLPAGGYRGEVPEPPWPMSPEVVEWWERLWRTPQAAAWAGGGFDHIVGRRAELAEAWIVSEGRPRLSVCRQLLEVDDRLGLSPFAMARLRWIVVPPEVEPEEDDEVERRRQERWARVVAESDQGNSEGASHG